MSKSFKRLLKNNLKKVSYLFSFFFFLYNWGRGRDFAVCMRYTVMSPSGWDWRVGGVCRQDGKIGFWP